MFQSRMVLVIVLCCGSVAVAQDAPVVEDAPEAAAESAPIVQILMEAVKKAGAPKTMDAKGIGVWALYIVIIGGVAYGAWRWRDNADLKAFMLDAGAAADHVYITKIEGKDTFDNEAARQAAMAFLGKMKGPTARILKKKGPEWAMAAVHRISNRKKKEGTDLKINKAEIAKATPEAA